MTPAGTRSNGESIDKMYYIAQHKAASYGFAKTGFSAGVDATAVLELLVAPPQPDPPGVTPLPRNAWLPLRAFVDYAHFERLMKAT